MSKAEEFIKAKTRNDSNTSRGWHNIGVSIPTTYTPWVVPNVAREAAKIAREETIREVCEWIKNNVGRYSWYDPIEDNEGFNVSGLIDDLKKYFKNKL